MAQRIRTTQMMAKRLLAGLLLAGLVLLSGGCLPFKLETGTTSTIYDIEFTSRTQQTTPVTTAGPTDSTSVGMSIASSSVSSGQTLSKQIRTLLLDGLNNHQTSISLDDAVGSYSIPEGDVQQTIDLVFEIFQDIYREHAEFFYLNGSINVGYTLAGQGRMLASMTIEPVYWPIMAGLDDAALAEMISEVEAVADQLAAEIRAQTTVPWRQLQLVHDRLIQLIRYDDTMNQDVNQAYSALIDNITLCQGYAQSFGLIGQRLGFDIEMVTGDADGTGHAWNLVQISGKWYHIDVTFDDPAPDGGSMGPLQHSYFLRSDSAMIKTHLWDQVLYPACQDDWAAYYREQGLTAISHSQLQDHLNDFTAGIDYGTPAVSRLEILYTGTDVPDFDTVENQVRKALTRNASGYSVHFSYQVILDVVIVDVSPDE